MGAEARALWIILMYVTPMVVPHNTATFAAAFSDIELVNTVYLMLRLHALFTSRETFCLAQILTLSIWY